MNNPTKLEVKVFDRVKVIDVVGTGNEAFIELTTHVLEKVVKWIESGSEEPLSITIKNLTSRGPPSKSLKINVAERVKVTSAFGTR